MTVPVKVQVAEQADLGEVMDQLAVDVQDQCPDRLLARSSRARTLTPMAERTESAAPRRRGRPPKGHESRRASIEEAARAEFLESGYAATSMRAIARRAEVDPALIRHYFADKAELFAAAVRLPARPDLILDLVMDGPIDTLGSRLIGALLAAWDDPEIRTRALPLFRSVIDAEGVGRTLPEFVVGKLMVRIADRLEVHDGSGEASAADRASLIASQVIGLIAARYLIRLEPLASLPAADVVARVGPVVQTYLTGPIEVRPIDMRGAEGQ